MSLLDDLGASLAPTVSELVAQFGVMCSVYRATQVRAADGTTSRTYVADASLTGVAALFRPVSVAVRERTFGQRSVATASLTFARAGTVPPTLDAFDAVKILTGPYANVVFVCEQPSLADGAALTCVVPVVLAPTTVVLP